MKSRISGMGGRSAAVKKAWVTRRKGLAVQYSRVKNSRYRAEQKAHTLYSTVGGSHPAYKKAFSRYISLAKKADKLGQKVLRRG